MKIAIIADDFTGANDSGVQFARSGLKASVLLNFAEDAPAAFDDDVVIIDTDSRSLGAQEAYDRVRTAAEFVKAKPFDVIFKKVDSTLRGNFGAEFDALQDVLQPDFIVCTPAYPEYNRTVRDGSLYLNGQLLHETEFALDPKTPITVSSIPELIHRQSKRASALISSADMALGHAHLKQRLAELAAEKCHYLVFDAQSEQELRGIVALFEGLEYRIVWAGSAGLAGCLTEAGEAVQENVLELATSAAPVLAVIGSVNFKTRQQLALLLAEPQIAGVRLKAHVMVAPDAACNTELKRVYAAAALALEQGRPVVLYSSGEPEEIRLAMEAGSRLGMGQTEVSDRIAEALGCTAATLVEAYGLNRLILTGGDTAKQFCSFAGMEKFRLLGEVETGVPIGLFSGAKEVYGVTKAGGFGSEDVFVRTLHLLQGGGGGSTPYPAGHNTVHSDRV
ncbi:four-carbon acid sugar kinase family protein [Paenibacillus algorifonticola]|uniref:four-carbon acid sugar kinase family protein n=1 Tax=Paenibacillus algorifonticola TaxID=684063 RepID=UPI003D28F976